MGCHFYTLGGGGSRSFTFTPTEVPSPTLHLGGWGSQGPGPTITPCPELPTLPELPACLKWFLCKVFSSTQLCSLLVNGAICKQIFTSLFVIV